MLASVYRGRGQRMTQTHWSLELEMLASVYLRGTDPLECGTWNANIGLSEREGSIGAWNTFFQLGGPFPTSSRRRSGLNYSLCLSSNAISYRGNKDYIKTTKVLGTLLSSLCVAINLNTKGKGIACRTPFPRVSHKSKRTKEQTNNQ